MAVFLLKLASDWLWYLAVVWPFFAGATRTARLIVLMAPCVYAVFAAVRFFGGREAGDFQTVFLQQIKVLAVAALFQLIIAGGTAYGRAGALFAALFLICGLLLLRITRLSGPARRDGRCWRLNAGALLAAAALAAALASEPVRRGGAAAVGAVYRLLILPLLLAVLQMVLWVVEALAPLIAPLFNKLPEMTGQELAPAVIGQDMDIVQTARVETPQFLKAAAAAAATAALALVFYYLYRRAFGGGDGGRGGPAATVSRRRTGKADGAERENAELFWKRDVRYYYRKFLRLCLERGMELKQEDTSEAVCRRAGRIFSGRRELSELRDLYRQARYGVSGGARVGDGQTEKEREKRARELYRSLKQEEKPGPPKIGR